MVSAARIELALSVSKTDVLPLDEADMQLRSGSCAAIFYLRLGRKVHE